MEKLNKTYLCQNGADYGECEALISHKGLCSDCEEKAYNGYLSDFYGGTSPMTQKEREADTMKKLQGIK